MEKGGFVGVTMFPPFLKRGTDSTVDDYVEAMDYIINIAGEDAVGGRRRWRQRRRLQTGGGIRRAAVARELWRRLWRAHVGGSAAAWPLACIRVAHCL